MRITTTAERYHAELSKWLADEIVRRGQEIIDGVPTEVYRERVAEVAALKYVFEELPRALQRAKD